GVLDVLDHSSPTPIFGAKLGLDLTTRFPGEPARSRRRLEPPATGPEGLLAALRPRLEGLTAARYYPPPGPGEEYGSPRHRVLILAVEKAPDRGSRFYAERLLDAAELSAFSIIVLYDHGTDLADDSRLLWRLLSNVDPERDLYLGERRILLDACRKGPADRHFREWPEELSYE
ncbi:MAG: menaquinone biosynthesis decarboxylase, partial [Thermodesulfobacteriota bacterium]